MVRYNGPIRVFNPSDGIPTDAAGGGAGGDQTAAALSGMSAQAQAAWQTVDNLSATATTGPVGSGASVTITGTVPNKTINFTIPRGRDGKDGIGNDAAVQVAMSQQAGTAMRVGVQAGTVGLLVIADSKGAGTGLTNFADRWQNRLAALMRARFPITGGDTMRGLIPANMSDPYNAMSGRPTTTGTTYPVDTAGLGYNTLQLELGSVLTFPAATWPAASTLPIGYHTHYGANGTLQVLIDGVVQTEINCAGAGEGAPMRTSIPITAGTHTVSMRPKAGTAPVRPMYIEQRSAETGWHLYDAARPGLAARHVVDRPGAPQGGSSFAAAVAGLPSVRLAVVALGANDMTISTPAQYGADLRAVVGMVKAGHPTAGVVVVLPAALTDDSAVVDDVQAYHTAARAALVDVPDLSIVAETQLVDLTGPNAGAWLADSVHPNAFGHDLISRALAGSLIGLDGPSDALTLVEAAAAPAVTAAQSAQTSAASSASSAANAVTLAQQAQAAALEVPDANTAAMIGNDTTDTVAALEARYRPAARSPITGWFHADRYGAGTVTAASIQAAVDAARQTQAQTGQGGTVYIPDPPPGTSWVMSTQINLYSRITIRGNARTKTAVKVGASIDQKASFPTLQGPGGGVPVFQIGQAYPAGADSLGASDVALDGISAHNNEGPVVRNYAGLNFRITGGCDLRSFYAAEDATDGVRTSAGTTPIQCTIELRYAYRGVIEQSTIGCARGWAIDARDNINGVAIRDNIISGGSAGGAISLNLVTAATIENNVIETSRDGIRLGTAGYPPYSSGDATLYRHPAGRCHAVNIRGNYLETCARYISMPWQEANGVTIEGNYLGGGLARSITPEYGILAGRLNGCIIKGNSWHTVGSEPFVKVQYLTGGTVTAPINCEIGPNHFQVLSGTPVIYDLTSYPNVAQRSAFAGRNIVWTTANGVHPKITGQREWTSGTLAANASTPFVALQSPSTAAWGAALLSVEVLSVSGSLTGARVQLGYSASSTAYADVALDSLTFTGGAAEVDLSTVLARADTANPLGMRVVAGSGTGSFQVRVKWRGL